MYKQMSQEDRGWLLAQNELAITSLLPQWIRNVTANETLIRGSHDVNELTDIGTGIPAILVATGPSLNCNIHLLQKARDKAFIVACDSALLPLIRAGCVPHMVVAADAKPQNKRFYEGTEKYHDQMILVSSSLLHPDVLAAWHGDICFFNPMVDGSSSFWTALPYLTGNIGSLVLGGNVLSAAMSVALSVMNCSSVAFVGADYCWYDQRFHHAEGAVVPKFSSDEVEEVADIYGRKAYYNAALKMYLLFAQAVFSEPFRRDTDECPVLVTNCTEGGLLQAPGIIQMPLGYYISEHLVDIEDQVRQRTKLIKEMA
jgi:hypothetical protein